MRGLGRALLGAADRVGEGRVPLWDKIIGRWRHVLLQQSLFPVCRWIGEFFTCCACGWAQPLPHQFCLLKDRTVLEEVCKREDDGKLRPKLREALNS